MITRFQREAEAQERHARNKFEKRNGCQMKKRLPIILLNDDDNKISKRGSLASKKLS